MILLKHTLLQPVIPPLPQISMLEERSMDFGCELFSGRTCPGKKNMFSCFEKPTLKSGGAGANQHRVTARVSKHSNYNLSISSCFYLRNYFRHQYTGGVVAPRMEDTVRTYVHTYVRTYVRTYIRTYVLSLIHI